MNTFKEPPYYRQFKQHLQDYLSHPEMVQLGRVSKTTIADESMRNYQEEMRLITSVNTKRVIFDARQATIFDKSQPIPVEGIKIQPPFDQLYIEFTEPVEIQAQEPGYFDKLVAILYMHDTSSIPVRTEKGTEYIPASMAIFILFNEEKNQWTDRAFRFSLERKMAFPAVMNVRGTADPSEIPADWSDVSWFTTGLNIPEMPNRHIGWWEQGIQSFSQLLCWMFSYMMAKSVKIEQIPLTRQLRRQLERQKGYVPQPWHRVWVEPKVFEKRISDLPGEGGEHGYRYDVISTLRFNKHKLKDGSYRHTIEFVPAHQRGLKHNLYIPKTYEVSGNRKILPETNEYFGQDVRFPKS
jgi:hypothetical protein